MFIHDWVVHAKPPFGGPDQVLNYLARYTHRVAISNYRLVALRDGQVSFLWRDYAHGGKQKIMTVSAHEFLRRFLLHVLPSGLVRIRHFGLFANRKRGAARARFRLLLGASACTDPPPRPEQRCPKGSGIMRTSSECPALNSTSVFTTRNPAAFPINLLAPKASGGY